MCVWTQYCTFPAPFINILDHSEALHEYKGEIYFPDPVMQQNVQSLCASVCMIAGSP